MFELKEEMLEKPFEIYLDTANKLAQRLVQKRIVDPKILVNAVLVKNTESNSKSGKLGRNLAQILVQDFNLDHDSIYREVADLYAFRVFHIPDEEREAALNKIKKLINSYPSDLRQVMLKHRVIPAMFDQHIHDKLLLAAVDPTLREIPKIAYTLNAKSYDILYFPLQHYQQVIEELIPPENEYLKNIENDQNIYEAVKDDITVDESLLEVEINKSALINLFEGALVEAVRQGASDVHIIPINSRETNISFRVDGRLNIWHKQEGTLPEAVIAVVKDRSRGLDRFEREQGQDGYIQREIDGYVIRFRVSILPIAGTEIKNKFESVVIRVLDDRNVITDLNMLGLSGYAMTSMQKALNQPQGMIILTGPTGCGKSTTIIAALHHVMDPSLNVLTVEDPIEYVIKGARQIKLSHKMGFDQAIRSILRHDPDIVLVGEIRDRETADIAIKLANTGHLTFTTLHTNDAPSVVSRLYKMGIEPFLLAYAINIIVAQRLIRKLCDKCKKPGNYDHSFFHALKLNYDEWKHYDLFEPVGCDKCDNTGYSGRIAIHETLYITKEISQIIFNAGDKIDEESIRIAAKKDGMLTLRESAFERVRLGITSFEEVISNTADE